MMVLIRITYGSTSFPLPTGRIANNNGNGDAKEQGTKQQTIEMSPQPELVTTTQTSLHNKIMNNKVQQSTLKATMQVLI